MISRPHKCGDANPLGNVEMFYKGGCKQPVFYGAEFRCTGCHGVFHHGCILKHFELEKSHDWGREQLRKGILSEIRKRFRDPLPVDIKLVKKIIKKL